MKALWCTDLTVSQVRVRSSASGMKAVGDCGISVNGRGSV